jgi:hypothetical protein
MAPLPAVPLVLRITLHHTDGGDVNVLDRFFMAFSGTAPTDAQLNTLCTAIGTAWNSAIGPMVYTSISLTEVQAQDLTSATAAAGLAIVSHAGTRTGAGTPAALCCVLKFGIARRYRGGHPRMYTPWGTEEDFLTPQTWSTTFLGEAIAAWNLFVGDIVAAPWSGGTIGDQVNVSYYEGFTNFTYPSGRTKALPKLRVTPLIDPIVSVGVNPHFASQRRRNQQRSVT